MKITISTNQYFTQDKEKFIYNLKGITEEKSDITHVIPLKIFHFKGVINDENFELKATNVSLINVTPPKINGIFSAYSKSIQIQLKYQLGILGFCLINGD